MVAATKAGADLLKRQRRQTASEVHADLARYEQRWMSPRGRQPPRIDSEVLADAMDDPFDGRSAGVHRYAEVPSQIVQRWRLTGECAEYFNLLYRTIELPAAPGKRLRQPRQDIVGKTEAAPASEVLEQPAPARRLSRSDCDHQAADKPACEPDRQWAGAADHVHWAGIRRQHRGSPVSLPCIEKLPQGFSGAVRQMLEVFDGQEVTFVRFPGELNRRGVNILVPRQRKGVRGEHTGRGPRVYLLNERVHQAGFANPGRAVQRQRVRTISVRIADRPAKVIAGHASGYILGQPEKTRRRVRRIAIAIGRLVRPSLAG